MDAAEPPHIVVEGPGGCPDPANVEGQLRRGIAKARAPGPGWIVLMRVERGPEHALRAEGNVIDGAGTPVAHRVLSGSAANCAGLARALGVWASLVLDAEFARASTPSQTTPEPSPGTDSTAPGAQPAAAAPEPAGRAPDSRTDGAPSESPPPREEPHSLELGLGGFVMSQTAGRSFAGATSYMVVEVGRGLFFRPALAVGESFPQPQGTDAQWYAARVDACWRLSGLYMRGSGLQLDFCGGADVGFTKEPTAASAYVALGPSIDFSGDMGEHVSLVLRGVGGANIVSDGWSGRLELALSWRLQ